MLNISRIREDIEVIIRTRKTLPGGLDTAWDALHNPQVFRFASWPLTAFRTPGAPLPLRFKAGCEYEVSVWAGGIVPMGRQVIRLLDEESTEGQKIVADVGRGLSGMLVLLHDWRHEMALSARPDGRTDFRDTLSLRAGLLTPLLWPAMQLLWWWRGYRLSRLLGQSAQRADGGER